MRSGYSGWRSTLRRLTVYALLISLLAAAAVLFQSDAFARPAASILSYSNTAVPAQRTSPTSSSPADDACDNVINPDYNPHTPPTATKSSGPWFEGWYARVSDAASATSFAVGIGHFPGQQQLSDPPAACFILVSSPDGQPMRMYSRNFASLDVQTPVSGGSGSSSSSDDVSSNRTTSAVSFQLIASDEPLTHDPFSFYPSSLSASSGYGSLGADGGGDFCYWRVTQGSVRIAASIGGTKALLRSETGSGTPTPCTAADPWGGPGGSSTPEGWLPKLGFLLRLQYDVLTLRTPVQYFLNVASEETEEGEGVAGARREGMEQRERGVMGNPGEGDGGSSGSNGSGSGSGSGREGDGAAAGLSGWRGGLLHLEKNWGASFPDQWVWAQGHRSQAGEQTSFVLAGGLLPHVFQPLIPPVRQFVLSYHPPPPAAPFTMDPWDPPLFSRQVVRGCEGLLVLELFSALHVVRLEAEAPPASFQALPCPTAAGFKNYSVESFSARVRLRVLRRPYPLAPPASASLLFEDTFPAAALEFGGAYVCPGGMPQLRGFRSV